MNLTEAVPFDGVGDKPNATVSSEMLVGGVAIPNAVISVSRKRRSRRDIRDKDLDVIGITATHLTVQAGQEDSDAMAKSSRTTNLDLSARNELGNTVYWDDVNLDGPITSINILELLNRDEGEDNDADDSIPAPCQRLVTKSTFRAGDRLGMVAASERNRLTIPEAVINTEKPVEIAVEAVLTPCFIAWEVWREQKKITKGSARSCPHYED
jgi:hypothetical protein